MYFASILHVPTGFKAKMGKLDSRSAITFLKKKHYGSLQAYLPLLTHFSRKTILIVLKEYLKEYNEKKKIIK